jgi:hypothetical protein
MPGQAISGSRADEHDGDLSADRRIVGYSVSPGAYCYSAKRRARAMREVQWWQRYCRGYCRVSPEGLIGRSDGIDYQRH